METFAGVCGSTVKNFSGDGGPAVDASLHNPYAIAWDGSSDLIIADTGNGRVRRVRDGIISTIAGPIEVAVDDQVLMDSITHVATCDGEVYFSGRYLNRIVKIAGNGTLVTVVGNGLDFNVKGGELATQVGIGRTTGLIVTKMEILFSSQNMVLSVSRLDALLQKPSKIFMTQTSMLVSEPNGGRIRRIFHNGTIVTVAGGGMEVMNETDGSLVVGDGGPATGASLSYPFDSFECTLQIRTTM